MIALKQVWAISQKLRLKKSSKREGMLIDTLRNILALENGMLEFVAIPSMGLLDFALQPSECPLGYC